MGFSFHLRLCMYMGAFGALGLVSFWLDTRDSSIECSIINTIFFFSFVVVVVVIMHCRFLLAAFMLFAVLLTAIFGFHSTFVIFIVFIISITSIRSGVVCVSIRVFNAISIIWWADILHLVRIMASNNMYIQWKNQRKPKGSWTKNGKASIGEKKIETMVRKPKNKMTRKGQFCLYNLPELDVLV